MLLAHCAAAVLFTIAVKAPWLHSSSSARGCDIVGGLSAPAVRESDADAKMARSLSSASGLWARPARGAHWLHCQRAPASRWPFPVDRGGPRIGTIRRHRADPDRPVAVAHAPLPYADSRCPRRGR